MTAYLKRYRDGDCDAVWQELIELGNAALRPPILNEATAIAEEIVRRIIHNASIIGQYLSDAGYNFETPGDFVIAADEITVQNVQQIEQEFGQLPLILQVWWRHVDRLNHLPTEEQINSGVACPTDGIYPSGAILINSPSACLMNSRQRAIDIAEHLRMAADEGIIDEES